VTAAGCPGCGASLPASILPVSVIAVAIATPAQEQEGLLGWCQIEVGPLRLAGLAIRRRRDGTITMTFPSRKDQNGDLHRQITALDPDLDGRIRAAVIAAYVAERAKHGSGTES
jgi:hypothetical protein